MKRKVFSFIAAMFLVGACQARPDLVDHTGIGTYFNRDQSRTYMDPYRGFQRRGEDFEALMLQFVAQAEETIDVAVQEFRLPRLAQALVQKYQEGVEVRVVLENSYNFAIKDIDFDRLEDEPEHVRGRHREYFAFVDMNNSGRLSNYEYSQRDAIHILRRGAIPMIDDTEDGSAGSGLMHHKFIIVDGRQVLVTSANFTTSDTSGDILNDLSRGNANASVILDSVEAAGIFEREFSILWGDGPGNRLDSQFGSQKPHRGPEYVQVGDYQITIQFSAGGTNIPWDQTSNGLISRTLSRAQDSIEAALFVFSEQWIADMMKEKFERQALEIKLVKEPVFAFRSYSEVLDMWGLEMLNEECRYEDGNNPWNVSLGENIGVASLTPDDFLHHKFAVIDGATVIFGSHNWSNSSNYQNDETLMVIESVPVARQFHEEFTQHFSTASLGRPHWLLDKISRKERECGF